MVPRLAARREQRVLFRTCEGGVWRRVLADGTQQEYGWVHDLSYTDSEGRSWRFHTLPCLDLSNIAQQPREALKYCW